MDREKPLLEKEVELYQQKNRKLEIFTELLELGFDCSKPTILSTGEYIYSFDIGDKTEEQIERGIKLLNEYKLLT